MLNQETISVSTVTAFIDKQIDALKKENKELEKQGEQLTKVNRKLGKEIQYNEITGLWEYSQREN